MIFNNLSYACLAAGLCVTGVMGVSAQVSWTDLISVQTDAASNSVDDEFSAIAPGQTSDVWSTWWRGPITGTYGGTIYRSRTVDGGATWAVPSVVATGDNNSIQLASDHNGTIIAVWHSYPSDADIYFSRSTDDGVNWSTPARLHSSMTSYNPWDYQPHIATDRDGTWVVVFERHETGLDYDVAFSRSTDNGATWSAPAFIDSAMSSDGSNTADHLPKVATDTNGNWVVSWQSNNTFSGTVSSSYYHLVSSRSTDDGATWSSMSVIDTADLFSAPGIPLSSPANSWMAADSTGNVNVVIVSDQAIASSGTDRDILCAHSSDSGANWSSLAVVNDWATGDSTIENYPTISCSDDGSVWIAGWVSLFQRPSATTDSNFWFSKSFDGGATWQIADIVNTNHATDTGYDLYPKMAFGHGKFVATMCAENFTGNDYDIVFTSGVADADLDQSSIDFGAVERDTTSSSSDVTLTNNGLDVLSVTSISITGTNSSQFAFAVTPDTSDLAAGEQRTISVQFAPTTDDGLKSASLDVVTSDPNDPTLSVSLSGTATVPACFEQWILF